VALLNIATKAISGCWLRTKRIQPKKKR